MLFFIAADNVQIWSRRRWSHGAQVLERDGAQPWTGGAHDQQQDGAHANPREIVEEARSQCFPIHFQLPWDVSQLGLFENYIEKNLTFLSPNWNLIYCFFIGDTPTRRWWPRKTSWCWIQRQNLCSWEWRRQRAQEKLSRSIYKEGKILIRFFSIKKYGFS